MAMNILLVEDDDCARKLTRDVITNEGHSCDTAGGAQEARGFLETLGGYEVAIVDLQIPETDKDYPSFESGFRLLEDVAANYPETKVLAFTHSDRIEHAVRALRLGAYDYIVKDPKFDVLNTKVRQIEKVILLKKENAQLRERSEFRKMVGESDAINQMLKVIKKVAPTEATVVIEGETGTGKELVARSLHQNSLRSEGPFVAVNCSAVPQHLFESELFGHEKGAFTGAHALQKGRFELAHKGTLFLDEVGEIPIEVQAKLLRVLEEKELMRVGGSKVVKVDVRIVAASNRNLKMMVEEGRFREDLFFRLNTIMIKVPSLAERTSDIPSLVNFFLRECDEIRQEKVSSGAMARLINYCWEGNVRQLKNVITRSSLLAGETNVLDADDILFDEHVSLKRASQLDGLLSLPMNEAMNKFEKMYLENTLRMYQNKKSKAADFAKKDRSNFYKKLSKHGLA